MPDPRTRTRLAARGGEGGGGRASPLSPSPSSPPSLPPPPPLSAATSRLLKSSYRPHHSYSSSVSKRLSQYSILE